MWGSFVGVDLSDGFLFMAGTGLEDEDEVSDARRFGDEADEKDEVAGEGDFEMDVAGGFVMILPRYYGGNDIFLMWCRPRFSADFAKAFRKRPCQV